MIKNIQNKLETDKNLKELLSGSTVTFVIRIFGLILSYLVVFIVSKKFDAEGTGIYTLTLSFLEIISILGTIGLNVAVLRYVGQFNTVSSEPSILKLLVKNVYKVVFPFSILLAIVIYFNSDYIATNIFGNSTYKNALKICAVVTPFYSINLVNVEYIRGLKILRISEFLRSINRPFLVILVVLILGKDKLNPVYGLVIAGISGYILSTYFIYNKLRKIKSTKAQINELNIGKLLKTSTPMLITSLFTFLLINAATFFIEAYSTSDQVGIFNVCLRIANLVSLILIVVNTIAAPKISELFWAKNFKGLDKFIQQASKMIFWISLVSILVVITFSNFILGVFGNDFKSGVTTLVYLAIGQAINTISGPAGLFLNMSGNQKTLRNIMAITTIFVLVGYAVLVPDQGIVGAAIVGMVGSFIINVFSVFYVYKKYKILTVYRFWNFHGTR
ncbi:flippase [Flagellimonas zhangzhouensis]|uniref:Membrane protein involved in the export of O-antigen and teichoic acid n=1 Tax=Flagellimonas zhangzhouensis TaxID=1073328 RepID=A0A1H2URG5_9FLAO|nr:flippase [Allomuricauda zhangzhouensis]SDQ14535.1 Membrane protein involved in the export of O-antigen and teichoic acid [Allomuricauda zhangzhouensis]SDW58640.1 Membrane protein involved in the export of O-antigen and teichoic acid [Allomuricauda zhangzhouensis]